MDGIASIMIKLADEEHGNVKGKKVDKIMNKI